MRSSRALTAWHEGSGDGIAESKVAVYGWYGGTRTASVGPLLANRACIHYRDAIGDMGDD